MKYLLVFLVGILNFACSNEESLKKAESTSTISDTVIYYFGTLKKGSGSFRDFDTLIFEKRIVKDTLLMFSYGESGDSSFLLLDRIQFKIRNKQILGIEEEYLEQTFVDTVIVFSPTGDSTLLFECRPKTPEIDGDGIHVISADYGLIIGYSRSWHNYYYIISTSDEDITLKILELQRLYLMTKSQL